MVALWALNAVDTATRTYNTYKYCEWKVSKRLEYHVSQRYTHGKQVCTAKLLIVVKQTPLAERREHLSRIWGTRIYGYIYMFIVGSFGWLSFSSVPVVQHREV